MNYLGLVETQRSGDFTCRINGAAGGRGYWDAAQQSIDDTLNLVRQAVVSGDVEHISVFAIAPIPLLVYLGWYLDDKTATRSFRSIGISSWAGRGQTRPSRSSLTCRRQRHRMGCRTSYSFALSRAR